MNPKSGKRIPPTLPTTPRKASDAVDEKSGQKQQAQAKAKALRPPKYDSVKVAPPEPPPPITPAPEAPPPRPKPPKACSIIELVVECEHTVDGKKRRPGPNNVLQVVPDARQTLSISEEVGSVKVSGSRKFGGDDVVQIQVKTEGAGRKQIAVSQAAGSPAESDWQDAAKKSFSTAPPELTHRQALWPAFEPWRDYYVYGRGCDDESFLTCHIQAFPSQQHEVSVSFDPLASIFSKIEDRLNETLKKMKFGPFEGNIQISPPAGEIKATYGWQEHSDWRAYFLLQVDSTLNLGGIFGGIKWDLLKSFMYAGAASLGIPPIVIDIIRAIKEASDEGTDKEDRYLAELYAKIGIDGSGQLTGSRTAKAFSTGEIESGEAMQVTLSCGLKAELGITAQAARWAEASASGNARIGFSTTGELTPRADGLFLVFKVSFDGIALDVQAKLKVWIVEYKEDEKWQVVPPIQVYPHPDSQIDGPMICLAGPEKK